jgi:hypothetical protein
MAVQSILSHDPCRGSIKYSASRSPANTVETIGYILRVYGHFHGAAYDPYVIMQAFVVCLLWGRD